MTETAYSTLPYSSVSTVQFISISHLERGVAPGLMTKVLFFFVVAQRNEATGVRFKVLAWQ